MALPPYLLAFGIPLFVGLLGMGFLYYQQKRIREEGSCYSNMGPGYDTRPDYNTEVVDVCSICLEELKQPLQLLPCEHKLHQECFRELITREKRCPECRRSFTM